MALLFTDHNGDIFGLTPDELPPSSTLPPAYIGLDGHYSPTEELTEAQAANHGDDNHLEFSHGMLYPVEDLISNSKSDGDKNCIGGLDGTYPRIHSGKTSPSPLMMVTNIEDSDECPVPAYVQSAEIPTIQIITQAEASRKKDRRSVSDNCGSTDSTGEHKKVSLAYNEYGELKNVESVLTPISTSDLSVTETLRLINRAYHRTYKARMRAIIVPQLNGTHSSPNGKRYTIQKGRLSSWEWLPPSPRSSSETTPDDRRFKVRVYTGPPRVLELGCADGEWCFTVKEMQPEWILEGLDDKDQWSQARPGSKFRDFMEPGSQVDLSDYFGRLHFSQEQPEFHVRNLNALIAHPDPIPENLYSLIRARDIFDRVENYKSFLEDIRRIVQPDGVVEFLEVDPRPRKYFVGTLRPDTSDHTSGPKTDWSDNIADRFKNPLDEELADTIPGMMRRVQQRLEATLRPRSGVAAMHLKSWLQGAGFWDVKQLILRLPIGGPSDGGQLLLDVMKQQVAMENTVPLLAAQIPQPELDILSSGQFFINLHIVTGRKPKYPRTGDLLLDGTRQEMTESKWDAMARLNDAKSNQWRRFDLDGELTVMMQNISTLHGGPQKVGPSGALEGSDHEMQSSEDSSAYGESAK